MTRQGRKKGKGGPQRRERDEGVIYTSREIDGMGSLKAAGAIQRGGPWGRPNQTQLPLPPSLCHRCLEEWNHSPYTLTDWEYLWSISVVPLWAPSLQANSFSQEFSGRNPGTKLSTGVFVTDDSLFCFLLDAA